MYNQKHDIFYIGQTYSLKKRLFEHKTGLGNYTGRYDGVWLYLYSEKFKTRSQAMQKEKYFKSLKSKVYLKNFIKSKRSVG